MFMGSKNQYEQLETLKEYKFQETPVLAGMVRMIELIAVKPIVENLGLSWSGAYERIQRDPNLSQLFVSAKTTAEDGKQREMICMKPTDLQNWLWNLNKTENMNVQLWEEYKKGLVVHLLMMLKISLDEVQRLRNIEEDFGIMKAMVTEFIQETEEGQNYSTMAKEKFKNAKSMKSAILERMNGHNPDQTKLF